MSALVQARFQICRKPDRTATWYTGIDQYCSQSLGIERGDEQVVLKIATPGNQTYMAIDWRSGWVQQLRFQLENTLKDSNTELTSQISGMRRKLGLAIRKIERIHFVDEYKALHQFLVNQHDRLQANLEIRLSSLEHTLFTIQRELLVLRGTIQR